MARNKRPGTNLSAVPKDLAGEAVTDFDDLLAVIERAKLDAARAINRELIGLYWSVGEHISARTRSDGWGKAVIARFRRARPAAVPGHQRVLAGQHLADAHLLRGLRLQPTSFTAGERSQLDHHILILAGAKSDEAREFYLRLTAANGHSKRELERQIDSMLFERTMISKASTRDLVEHRPALVSPHASSRAADQQPIAGAYSPRDFDQSIRDRWSRTRSPVGSDILVRVDSRDWLWDRIRTKAVQQDRVAAGGASRLARRCVVRPFTKTMV